MALRYRIERFIASGYLVKRLTNDVFGFFEWKYSLSPFESVRPADFHVN